MKVHEECTDIWNVPNDSQEPDASKAQSRRNCWVSNENVAKSEIITAKSVRTPKKVNFRSVEEVNKKIFYIIYLKTI